MIERSTGRQAVRHQPPPEGVDNGSVLLTAAELARLLRASPRTLEGWRYRGVGPRFLKIEGRICYRQDDVDAYVAGARRDRTLSPPAAP